MTRIRNLPRRLRARAARSRRASPAAAATTSSDEDPQTVLDETFNNDTKVTSGDLSLTASVSAEGEQGGSFEASLGGPFQGDPENPTAIPQLDWTASAIRRGRRPEHRLRGRPRGHRGQRLRRVQRQRLRGRHRAVRAAARPARGPGRRRGADRGSEGTFAGAVRDGDRAGRRRPLGLRHRLRELAHRPDQRGHRGRRRHRDRSTSPATPTSRRCSATSVDARVGGPAGAAAGLRPERSCSSVVGRGHRGLDRRLLGHRRPASCASSTST